MVGMMRDEDVEKLLIMTNPETWDPTFDKGMVAIKKNLNGFTTASKYQNGEGKHNEDTS